MTTALASWVPASQALVAGTGTGRASLRHRLSASRQVKASTARLPSSATRVGSAISVDFSVPWSSASAGTATTGTSSRDPVRAVSAAYSLPRPAAYAVSAATTAGSAAPSSPGNSGSATVSPCTPQP